MVRLTDKDEYSDVADGDILMAVDISDTTSDPAGTSKGITASNLRAYMSALSLPLAGGTINGILAFRNDLAGSNPVLAALQSATKQQLLLTGELAFNNALGSNPVLSAVSSATVQTLSLDGNLAIGSNNIEFAGNTARINKVGSTLDIFCATGCKLIADGDTSNIITIFSGRTTIGIANFTDVIARNSVGADTRFFRRLTNIVDRTDGIEKGDTVFEVMVTGTSTETLLLSGTTGNVVIKTNLQFENPSGADPILSSDDSNKILKLEGRLEFDNIGTGSDPIFFSKSATKTLTAQMEEFEFFENTSTIGPINEIRMAALNDAAELIFYAQMDTNIADNSDGSEDGTTDFSTIVNGTITKILGLNMNMEKEVFIYDNIRFNNTFNSLSGAIPLAGGSSYVNGETISFTGTESGATNATATITVVAGAITAYAIVIIGSGYKDDEILNIIGGSGTGATATAITTFTTDPVLFANSTTKTLSLTGDLSMSTGNISFINSETKIFETGGGFPELTIASKGDINILSEDPSGAIITLSSNRQTAGIFIDVGFNALDSLSSDTVYALFQANIINPVAGNITGSLDILAIKDSANTQIAGFNTKNNKEIFVYDNIQFKNINVSPGADPILKSDSTLQALTLTGQLQLSPTSVISGLNVGSRTGTISTQANGDIWYDSGNNKLLGFINGGEVDLGAAGIAGVLSINGDTTSAALIVGTTNQITVGTAGGTTTINVGSDVVIKTAASIYTAGARQDFSHSATTAGLRIIPVAGDPSARVNGDIWLNLTTNKIFCRINTNDVDLGIGGGSGITSINTDTTSNQIIAGGTGIDVGDVTNTHTISIDSTVATLTGSQTLTNKTFGGTLNEFEDNALIIQNPANTFTYQIIASAIAGDRTVTLPLLTANDTFVTLAFAQTLTNKTITLGGNNLTGTAGQFNTALSGDSFVFLSDVPLGNASGILGVANGGTGVATFTAGGILYGNTATDILVTAAPISGQIIVGDTIVPKFVTMSGDATIDNTGEVTVSIASTDLSDSSDLARVTTANSYGAGNKQSFVASGTTAGININNQVPSTTIAGDLWRTTDALTYRNNAGGADLIIATTIDLGAFLPLAGGTMTGNIAMGANEVQFGTGNEGSIVFVNANDALEITTSSTVCFFSSSTTPKYLFESLTTSTINDIVGKFIIGGLNTVSATVPYSSIFTTILDNVSTSEDASVTLAVIRGGAADTSILGLNINSQEEVFIYNNIRFNNTLNAIVILNLTSGGTGYIDAESVTITGVTSGANNAVATITVSGGVIQTVIFTVRGSGYTDGESLTILGQTSTANNAVATVDTGDPILFSNSTARILTLQGDLLFDNLSEVVGSPVFFARQQDTENTLSLVAGVFELFEFSAAIGTLPFLAFRAHNDNATPEVISYAALQPSIISPADGSEIGKLEISTMVGGALVPVVGFNINSDRELFIYDSIMFNNLGAGADPILQSNSGVQDLTLTGNLVMNGVIEMLNNELRFAGNTANINKQGGTLDIFCASGCKFISPATENSITIFSGLAATGDINVVDVVARNDAVQDVIYFRRRTNVTDRADGTENGTTTFSVMVDGTLTEVLKLDGITGHTLIETSLGFINSLNGIAVLNLTNGGTGYTEAGESVTITGAVSGANNAVATVTVSGGVIQSVEFTDRGSGYANGESLTILGLTSGASNAISTATTGGSDPILSSNSILQELSLTGGLTISNRFQEHQGANVTSISNDLTLGTDGNVFFLGDANTIERISGDNWQIGSKITLIVGVGGTTITAGVATGGSFFTLVLAGGAFNNKMVETSVTFVFVGNSWVEIARVG